MAAPTLDIERAALILVDAMALGDRAAARKWGICAKTIARYRTRCSTDAELSSFVREKKRGVEHDLSAMRVAFLRRALKTMGRKLKDGSLYDIAGAVKIVGELHQVSMAVDDERPDSPDPETATDESGDGVEAFGAH